MNDTRVCFRDVKPYDVPSTLDQLRGPLQGDVELRRAVFWAPGEPRISLDTLDGVRMAYRIVITQGAVEDQIEVLNQELLVAVWADLVLPDRVRAPWEERFPDLRPF
jgi:hypothetical protein